MQTRNFGPTLCLHHRLSCVQPIGNSTPQACTSSQQHAEEFSSRLRSADFRPTFETGPWVIQAINLSQVDNFTTTPETKFKPRTSTCKKKNGRRPSHSPRKFLVPRTRGGKPAIEKFGTRRNRTLQPHISTQLQATMLSRQSLGSKLQSSCRQPQT